MSFNQLIIQQSQSFSYRLKASDFELSRWRADKDSELLLGGRGTSLKIKIDGNWFVLRRYLRGGLMSRFLKDEYFWAGLRRSRPFQEHNVVEYALQHDLPVPEVLGYCVQKSGLFYRASILSRFIPNQGTLAAILDAHNMSDKNWLELGALIKRLHRVSIFHADLNANNILLGDDGRFYLIDFDKARIMPQKGAWTEHTLQRLLRSLDKIQLLRKNQGRAFHFNAHCWSLLLEGYK